MKRRRRQTLGSPDPVHLQRFQEAAGSVKRYAREAEDEANGGNCRGARMSLLRANQAYGIAIGHTSSVSDQQAKPLERALEQLDEPLDSASGAFDHHCLVKSPARRRG